MVRLKPVGLGPIREPICFQVLWQFGIKTEAVRFELTIPFRIYLLSKQAH